MGTMESRIAFGYRYIFDDKDAFFAYSEFRVGIEVRNRIGC